MKDKLLGVLLGIALSVPVFVVAQDWYEASGVPAQRGALNSSDLRSEFASIESDLADRLPVLAGNGGRIIRVNSGGTALEAASTGIAVSEGGTGATTLTGLLQGNGTSAVTAITNSTTVGQTLRVTASNTYGWGALDLADGDAITGDLPDANLSANIPLLNAVNSFTSNMTIGGDSIIVGNAYSSSNSSNLVVAGGNSSTAGGNVELYGGTHATLANHIKLDGAQTDIRAQDGATTIASFTTAAVSLAATALTADAGGGNDEVSVSSGAVAMIGTISGGASGGIDMTPESGRFTAAVNIGCTTDLEVIFDYQRIGNIVVLGSASSIQQSCTSDTAQFVAEDALPASITPASGVDLQYGPLGSDYEDNGTDVLGFMFINGGDIGFLRVNGASGDNWTASGTRGIPGGIVMTYILDNIE